MKRNILVLVAGLFIGHMIGHAIAAERNMTARLSILNIKTEQDAKGRNDTIITLGVQPEENSDFQVAGSCQFIYKGTSKHEAGQTLTVEIR